MKNIKKDFPIFSASDMYDLVYLDTASTSLKPQQMLDSMHTYYTQYTANIYRGIHAFGEKATEEYEKARDIVAAYIGAERDEVVFTSGTTESINFIAATWAIDHLKADDEIIISELEHHANLLPWQWVAHKTGASLTYIPVHADGTLDMHAWKNLLSNRTKLVSVSHISNAVGTIVDINTIIDDAHAIGARVLIDAAQSIGHHVINVHALDVDFLAFSGHKILGPTGIGILYIKRSLHDAVEPYQRGGSMVYNVALQTATWRKSPQKFEAGTPPIAQAIGLGAAITYMKEHIDMQELKKHQAGLCAQLINGLQSMPRIRILGPIEQLKHDGQIVSFVVDGIHAHDVAAYLDIHQIAVRAGNHCAQPLAQALEYNASVRASFYVYNTSEDVDKLLAALHTLLD